MTVNTTTGEIVDDWMNTNDKGQVANTLEELEGTIEQGLHTFIEVGQALAEIRDRRLYRNDFDTFEDYCSARWSLTRKRAYDLIGAANIVASMSPIGDTPLPANEAQARELAPLRDEPQIVRDVWKDVQRESGGRPTAALVRQAVKRHLNAVPAPVQDEEFWNDAAERATASGWVAKRDAERPYSMAVVRLTRVAGDINGIEVDPATLGENLPEHLLGSVAEIQSAANWLNTFLAAHKESE